MLPALILLFALSVRPPTGVSTIWRRFNAVSFVRWTSCGRSAAGFEWQRQASVYIAGISGDNQICVVRQGRE